MRRGGKSLFLPCFVLLVAAALGVRPAAPAGADAPPLTFSAETEVVTVDVLVLDEHDKPVAGLTREDFRVLEDGRPQAVTSFEAIEAKLPPAPPPAAAAPPSAARVVSNAEVPPTRRTFGIVFDDLHLDALEVEPVRKALRVFLARETRPGDRLVLLTTSDGRFWTTTRGAETESFARALEEVRSHRSAQLGNDLRLSPVEAMRLMKGDRTVANRVRRRRAILSGLCTWVVDRCDCDRQPAASTMGAALGATDPDGCVEPPGGQSPEEAYSAAVATAGRSLAVLREAIAMLGAQRDRKALVLVSTGFMMDASLGGFREVRDAAARSNVVLYFLDARGLVTGPDVLGATTRAAIPPLDLSATMVDWRQEADGARTLAEETGGLSLQTNDFQGALQRVADESRVTYLLGYEPPASRRDGRYHELKVEVARRGLRVRARAGYFAGKGEKAAGPDAVQRALQDPFDRAELPLRLATYVLGPAPAEAGQEDGKAKVEVLVATELRQDVLESRVVDGRRVSEAQLLLDVGSRDRATETSGWRLKIPAESKEQAPAGERWHPFATRVLLEPGAHRLRLVAESGGRVGSLTTDLVVPKLGDERLSTPILSHVRAGEGRLPVLPIASRSFATASTLHCWVELHGAQAAPDSLKPRTSASFRARAADGREWAAGTFDAMAGAQERTEWLVSIPLGGAPTGENELVLSIRDLVSGRSFESSEPFRVEAPLAVAAAPAADAPQPGETGPAAGTADEKGAETDGREVPLATLLERAGAYVLRYGDSFRNLVADEAYRQVEFQPGAGLTPSRVLNLRSDVVFVPLVGSIPWGTFRDVYDVDGEKVHDRDQRLERLFAKPSVSALEQARSILKEGARYNLGKHGMDRTINAPTLGLLFLLPENQGRLVFKRKGTKTIAGFKAVELAFEEKTSPTLVRDRANDDVAASGRFWVDPIHGTVLQTRIEYDIEKSKRIVDREVWAKGFVVTEFRREPALDIFVPDTMVDWYMVGATRYLEGRASYSNYRRFQVRSDWEATETTPSEPPALPPQQK